MAIEHNSIADGERHEPKGIASASSGQVYIADGGGSGSWTDPKTQITLPLSIVIADVSTAETVYVAIPYAGTITGVWSILEGAIATGDATITVKNSAGTSMGTLTITQSGSAAGDVDSNTSLTNNAVTDADYITVETDGASTNTVKLWLTIELLRS